MNPLRESYLTWNDELYQRIYNKVMYSSLADTCFAELTRYYRGLAEPTDASVSRLNRVCRVLERLPLEEI
jgi:hypothetical protein